MTNVYFVRHGESTANLEKICAGHTDVDLTPKGFQQAREAAKELAQSDIKIDKIVSSPLIRAYKTAKIIAEEIGYDTADIVLDENAIEGYRGGYEGLPSSEQEGATDTDYARMGAESNEDMARRANDLQKRIDSLKVDSVLVVSHNQFGCIFVASLRGHPLKAELGKIPNAKVFKI